MLYNIKGLSKIQLENYDFSPRLMALWIYSKFQAKQSCIVLDMMKPYWFACRSFRITNYNLSDKILVRILMLQFKREIGL
jgi:hypothetical protein